MEQGQKVEVISVCDTGGGLRPLRFRFEGEDHQLHRVDIDQVLSTRRCLTWALKPSFSFAGPDGRSGNGCWN